MPLPATAALGNSHRMDFSLNPQINICSGRNILLLDVVKPSAPSGMGIGGHMASGCPSWAWVHSWISALLQAAGCGHGLPLHPSGTQSALGDRVSLCRQECHPRTLHELKHDSRNGKERAASLLSLDFSSLPALPPTCCVTLESHITSLRFCFPVSKRGTIYRSRVVIRIIYLSDKYETI